MDIKVEKIAAGPNSYFYGYYQACPWNTSGKYILVHEIDFENLPPKADDAITIGIVDLKNDNNFLPITKTYGWSWQQASMAQWFNGDPENKIIYNDRRDGRHVSVILDIRDKSEKVLPRPMEAVSSDGRTVLSINFSRLQDERPGYGYAGIADPYRDELAPAEDGIFSIDVESGESKLIFTLAQAAQLCPLENMNDSKHWFNHLLFTPGGERFVMLHRWRDNETGKHHTRMLTADSNGDNVYILNDHEMTSHFDWRDEGILVAFARRNEYGDRYFLFRDKTQDVESIIHPEGTDLYDGHCTYSPDKQWILSDSYPDENQERHLFIYHVASKRFIELGRFHENLWTHEAIKAGLRCDLHPRWSRDGKKVCFDSTHEGKRGVYVIDVKDILDFF